MFFYYNFWVYIMRIGIFLGIGRVWVFADIIHIDINWVYTPCKNLILKYTKLDCILKLCESH